MIKKLIPLVFGLVFLGLGVFAANLKNSSQSQTPADQGKTSTEAFDQAASLLMSKKFPDHAGAEQVFSQWKGKLLIINFWATWCSPCVKEMPELSSLQQELKNSNVQLIGMGIDSPANIADFAKKYQINYPLLLAGVEGSELSRKLGNQAGGLPFTVIISPQGKVLKTYLGRLDMEILRADIQKIDSSQVQH